MVPGLMRWFLTVLGSVVLGAGLVLHAQVVLAEHSRAHVQNTFFLWRGIGQLTFVFQDDQTKMALWFNEVPERLMRISNRAALILMTLGTVLALLAPFTFRGGRRPAGAR